MTKISHVFVLNLTNDGHLAKGISSRQLRGGFKYTSFVENSVFELFSPVVDSLRYTINNDDHIMKITGNFYRIFVIKLSNRIIYSTT